MRREERRRQSLCSYSPNTKTAFKIERKRGVKVIRD
jgi:hypothetical protein